MKHVTRNTKHALIAGLAVIGCVAFIIPTRAASLKDESGPFVPNADEFASAVVMVPGTHQVLYAFKPGQIRTAASLSKLAGALAWTRKGALPWNQIVTMSKADEVGGGRLRLTVGTKILFRDLWYSSITASANNAAMALGRVYPGGARQYVAQMNAEAKKAGAKSTVYYDPSGMNPQNMTTAMDMALVADAAFHRTDIRLAATRGTYSFKVWSTGTQKTITNTNRLLIKDTDVYVAGGKTGYLEESQYNIAVTLRPMLADGIHGDVQKEVVVVVLGAPTKEGSFDAAKRLAQWAWENHQF